MTFEFNSIEPGAGVDGLLPHCSGVFRIFDTHGNIILLDKTHDIARRIGSFYSESREPRTLDLRNITSHIEYCRTDSPLETLYVLYSERRRWFPGNYRTMRTFPRFHLLKINDRQRFPRIYASRSVKRGVHYFGPFRTRSELDRLRSTLERTFRIRPCKYNIRGSDPYPDCLYFQMHTCSRPCNGDISRASYLDDIRSVIAFIEGREGEVIERLTDRIRALAEKTRFEEAERLRRQIERIRRSRSEHLETYFDLWHFDYVAVMKSDSIRKRKVAIVKSGRILRVENHLINDIEDSIASSIDRRTSKTDQDEERTYDEFCLVASFLIRPVKSVRLFPLGESGMTPAEIAAEVRP